MPLSRALGVPAIALVLSSLLPIAISSAATLPDDPVRVTHVEARATDGRDPLTRAGLGDVLTVRVVNLRRLLELAGNKRESIALYLNGIPIDGIAPARVDTTAQELSFHLRRDKESARAWTELFGSPKDAMRQVSVSVGVARSWPAPTDVKAFNLVVIRKVRAIIYGVVAIALLIAIWQLAVRSNILRDAGDPLPAGKRRPYSLGRTQMAFWFVLTLVSFLFIWVVTESHSTMTPGLLALMGLSSATGLAAVLVDAQKKTAVTEELDKQIREKEELEAGIAALEDRRNQTPAPADAVSWGVEITLKRSRLAAIQRQIDTLRKALAPPESDVFWRDLLSDGSGIALHRLQIIAWTCALGAVFCFEVYRNLAMPDFDTTLLLLMGISSGTYLGFKYPERQA